jgi:hypothetical protein
MLILSRLSFNVYIGTCKYVLYMTHTHACSWYRSSGFNYQRNWYFTCGIFNVNISPDETLQQKHYGLHLYSLQICNLKRIWYFSMDFWKGIFFPFKCRIRSLNSTDIVTLHSELILPLGVKPILINKHINIKTESDSFCNWQESANSSGVTEVVGH